ncbi:hypothetical protein COT95_02180 [Candidatus Falkowbacteria bacterium CG10_big_fil_rev_8_21_14_0_10_37_6]|uniref:Uncharacterized protein n=1 Tax=Candidatus Falkowbacteria bacterium CG10_big_fil_rev_8_21_14_0_10_37_6 TaxID=1974563 RepID=A0A2H0V6X1_9BACT|nr:MAG: hypothetical protein COT95_02180 [Candidatus Falkowbacteria bacterium CG10_big_fil_rev_8_21_14_0_10_37_6]
MVKALKSLVFILKIKKINHPQGWFICASFCHCERSAMGVTQRQRSRVLLIAKIRYYRYNKISLITYQ